ncbi:hypothetical protein ASD86_02215 [Lysobacter sp. Root690]|nr:hypothetical protein ASD86_02215 [Lysobacter sp. Root690]
MATADAATDFANARAAIGEGELSLTGRSPVFGPRSLAKSDLNQPEKPDPAAGKMRIARPRHQA